VKAVDTGVLLALLEGSPKAREQLRRLRGTEVATTEANLLELGAIAGSPGGRAKTNRLEVLERLRQRVTVLPVDARSSREAARLAGKAGEQLAPHVHGMLGALEAAGCQELLTDDRSLGGGPWSFRVRVITV
jgi:predicted nucleic acid-binding protein